ncbi:O-antigen ligase family protein [Rhizobium sp. 57MFTsu3.2]|uniref:O-antigen ligase family protein n=1 Tax=Rhizobium sp. 57MFTsu3.2 TaxID=1048681 RepID=UPI00146F89FD|nr:O-antigen ligase family protein [Rhizobium sp. 57MFTsu3.2]
MRPLPTKAGLPFLVTVFVVSLFVPMSFGIGGLMLSPFRIVMLATVVPCFCKWVSGGAGQLRVADFTLFFYCLWCSIALSVVHGVAQGMQSGGILFIETMGAYLIARCYIRSAEDFYNVILLFYRIMLLLLPFALFEATTGINILLKLAGSVFPGAPVETYDTRWGLRRVQSIIDHPILFGVITSCMFGPAFFVLGYGKSVFEKLVRAGVVFVIAFLSMSSGPISGLFAQLAVTAWDRILAGMKARWTLFAAGIAAVYAAVALGSNQTFFQFFITHFSFSSDNAYYRVLIWEFGTGSVAKHPWFGTTMTGWDRPDWMPPSIDMFWLFHAILYGIPAAAAMFATFAILFMTIAWRRISDERLISYRMGYLTSLTSFFLVGWTVHFWNTTYVMFIFIVGAGVWLLDAQGEGNCEAEPRPTRGALPRRERSGRAREAQPAKA